MISQCLNPTCGKPLDYLRNGRVVRAVRKQGMSVAIEHYWLCGECYLAYKFCFSSEGEIALTRRPVTSAAGVAPTERHVHTSDR